MAQYSCAPKPPVHVMVDIETLGTKPGSVIAGIAAVTFDPFAGELGDSFTAAISIESCLDRGLTIDPKTMAWWNRQSNEARRRIFEPPYAAALCEALRGFYEGLRNLDGEPMVWAHGATFDPVLLAWAFDLCGIPCPWAYTNVRDTRTIFDLAFAGTYNKADWMPPGGLEHDALDDAVAQARAVCGAYVKLGLVELDWGRAA